MKPSTDGHAEKSAENTETAADALLDRWSRLAKESSLVDPTLYVEYDVKRGLRDVYGHGVLAGLTQIGDVVGAAADGDILVPIPGQLIYRGISITELVDGFVAEDRLGFEETCYLILFGELPNEAELGLFHDWVATHRVLPKRFVHDALLRMPSRDIMNAMARNVLALYVLDENPDDISITNILQQSLRLISTFPVLAVYAYRAYAHHFKDRSLVIRSPLAELSTAENILRMLRPDNQYSKLEAMVLDLTLVLHAEHGGGNNSSFTAHVVSSSGTDTYATIAAALGSLKGPRHGGANIKAVQMFEEIKGEVKDWEDDDEVENYLLRMLNKDAFDRSGLIYGMGHPVYSISDPRTLILKQYAAMLAEEKGLKDEYRLHAKVEALAPAAIAKSRRMYKGVSANIDFYSGFVYSMLNIPPELFTPLFAVSRIVGWCAHRIEEIANSGKIIRPAYKSVAPRRAYVPLNDR
ncbi:MAG: citrate/2-methylcitrate synthase [Candidatus Aquicultor sp.]|nr:citrate/2-methylcitrate synthase [Candidatus Aquicultor sp.]